MEQKTIETSLADYVPDDLKHYVEEPEVIQEGQSFTQHYKEELFLIWYKSGKPMAKKLAAMCSPDIDGRRPNFMTVGQWMRKWKARADELDAQVGEEIERRLIAEKVEMLSRHAKIGKNAQEKAIAWLEENYDQLTAASAIRLLDVGLRTERESRGIPAMLEGITKMSDDELLESLKKEISKANVEIEMLED